MSLESLKVFIYAFILLSTLMWIWKLIQKVKVTQLKQQPTTEESTILFTFLIPPVSPKLPPVEPTHYHAPKILEKEVKQKYTGPKYIKSRGHRFF